MTLHSPAVGANLRLIERSFPEGTIFTIYSINLRYLFELEEERKITDEIKNIKLESIIITWIKSRYLQKKFKLEQNTQSPNSDLETTDLFSEYKAKFSDPQNSKTPVELVKELIKELINSQGEIFFFYLKSIESNNEVIIKNADKIKLLACIVKGFEREFNKLDEEERLFKRQLKTLRKESTATEDKLKEINRNLDIIDRFKKLLYNGRIDLIARSYEKQLSNLNSIRSNGDFSINEIEIILEQLDENHKNIHSEKRINKQKLYYQIRQAEKFLASDEFGKFAEDPFFKISKSEKRTININEEDCELENVTEEEKRTLENGHEFSIFRGHLKDKWLNALTYKIKSNERNAVYYIRLSKLGLLQIRKEVHLGTFRGRIDEVDTDEFKKSIAVYQSQYLPLLNEKTRDEISEKEKLNLTFKEMGIKESDPETITKAKKKLEAKNLIDILTDLLSYQKRYDRTESDQPEVENIKNSDDILQVAAGFAQLLEFQTNSNFSRLFGKQRISPLSIEKLRKRRGNLERQKYILLFFTDIKKANSNAAFQPADLERSFPQAISCLLQGALEDANREEGIKILQYTYGITETGYFEEDTLNKIRESLHKRKDSISKEKNINTNETLKKELNQITDYIEHINEQLALCKFPDNLQDENEIKNYRLIKSIANYKVNRALINEKPNNKLINILDYALEDIYIIPQISDFNDHVDVSTWENEICIFRPERGFIFFNNKHTLEASDKTVEYKDYWRCIVRGVEYTVALRATLQLLESRTTRLLDSVPEILELLNSKNETHNVLLKNAEENKKRGEKRLKDLAEDLASVLKILPGLRSIAIPTNAFRSGHSVRKFKYLYNDCFNFKEILGNIQKNIDELTDFLTFFEQQQLQLDLDKKADDEAEKDRKLSLIALLLTITSIFYVFPSFVKDFSEWVFVYDEWRFVFLTLLYILILALSVILSKNLHPKFLDWFFKKNNRK